MSHRKARAVPQLVGVYTYSGEMDGEPLTKMKGALSKGMTDLHIF
jgi:hypothetical protein